MRGRALLRQLFQDSMDLRAHRERPRAEVVGAAFGVLQILFGGPNPPLGGPGYLDTSRPLLPECPVLSNRVGVEHDLVQPLLRDHQRRHL